MADVLPFTNRSETAGGQRTQVQNEGCRDSSMEPRNEVERILCTPDPSIAVIAELKQKLRVATDALRPFANYENVLALIAEANKRLSPTNNWRRVDPILGARGQIVTRGNFMDAAAALAEIEGELYR